MVTVREHQVQHRRRGPDTAVLPPDGGSAGQGPEREHGGAVGTAAVHRLVSGPDDLCVAKLCAHREKDLNFVRALHDAGLVDAIVMAERLGQVDARHQHAAAVALRWLGSLPVRAGTASPEAPADMPSTDDVDPPWERVSRRLDGAAN